MFRVEAFGGLVVVDEAGAKVASQHRRLALLALLAAAGARGLSRAKIQVYLWPESASDSARHGLEQLLYYLRRQLAPDVFLGPDPLRLNPSVITSDVGQFELAVAQGALGDLPVLYRGPFLDGFYLTEAPEFERWAEEERSRFAAAYSEALQRLARDEGEHGRHAAAVEHWRRLVAADPLDSRITLGLMQAMAAAGDRVGAVRLAREHEARLRHEFGGSLSPEVGAFAAQLRSAAAAQAETHAAGPLSDTRQPPVLGATHSSADTRTSQGVGLAVASPRERQRGGPRLLALGVTVGVLASIGVFATLARRSRGAPALDPNLVAVAPFEVLDPRLGLWREGLVDVLSGDLDGAGPVRAVPPTLVVRRWRGRVDRASAVDLARRTGARSAVFGRLARLGGDSVRLTASLLDAARGNVVADVELRAPESQLDRLTDSLTLAVLRGLRNTHLIGALRSASLGAASLPALKAYLQGEQYYRRWATDSALASFQQAIALDTTFAMATFRAAELLGPRNDSLAQVFDLRAGALNHGVAPRDSLLLTADSLLASAVFGASAADTGTPSRRRRLVATLETATKRYPDDPEIWYEFGEAMFHMRWNSADSLRQTKQAFDRAIALDSTFGLPQGHAWQIAGYLHDWADARRRSAALLRWTRPTNELGEPSGELAAAAKLVHRLLGPSGSGTTSVDSLLRTVPLYSLGLAFDVLQGMSDSAEAAVGLARAFYSRRRDSESSKLNLPTGDLRLRSRLLVSALGYRGHLLEAAHILGPADCSPLTPYLFAELPSLFAELSLEGGVSSDTARLALSRCLRRNPLLPAGALVFALPWWSASGDTLSLKEFGRHAAVAAASAPVSVSADPNLDDPRYAARAASAYLELARHDTSAALRHFALLPLKSCPWCFLDRLTYARILAARHHDRDALATLSPGFPLVYALPTRTVWELDRARIAERLNDREAAINGYRFVTQAWVHADPVLQPYVAEAQAALHRLTPHSGS
jgi:serine/threonine-protein kinase